MILLVTAAAALIGAVNPLSPRSPLVIQCHSPDLSKNTCKSIATYVPDGHGSFKNRAEVMIAPTGPVVLVTTTPVRLRGAAICGTLRREDITQGQVRVGTTMVPADKAAEGLRQIADAFASTGLLGPEFCTRYRIQRGSLIAEVSLAGKRRPDFDQPVIWLDAKSDVTVGP